MKHIPQTPALNALEVKAATLVAVAFFAKGRNLEGKFNCLIRETWDAALTDFVTFEAEYLGIEKDFAGAHQRARELIEGL